MQPPQSQVCFSPVIIKLTFPFKVLLYALCWQIYCRTTHHIYLLSKHWLSASPDVRHCASFWVPKDECSSVQFSLSVVSDSLQPHGLQHASPPCPSPTPGVYPNSCPLSQWCHPTISSSVIPFSSCPQSLPASVFSNESTLRLRWPKYWSFSFSIIPSKEIPGVISFRMYWLDLLDVQGTLESLLQHHSSKASKDQEINIKMAISYEPH